MVKYKHNIAKRKDLSKLKKEAKNKTKKKIHFNVKKNLGRLVALIVIICMLLATSATLIAYLVWY